MQTTELAFPAELAERPQWVVWKAEKRPGDPKLAKVPYDARTGRKASSTDPASWAALDVAVKARQAGRYSGVGYVFTRDDPFVGIDLDGCRDPKTGEIKPRAEAIMNRFASYTELSPSGTGVHIIVKGALPEGRRKKGPVEMYEYGRYFTMTGQRLPGTPDQITDCPNLAAIHAEIFEVKPAERRKVPVNNTSPVSLDDAALLDKARAAKNGARFDQLWRGDWQGAGYPSQSEADQALCNMLAFWTDRDRGRIDSLFRQSGLCREKWDRRHHGDGRTYGQGTVDQAVAATTDTYSSQRRQQGKSTGKKVPAEAGGRQHKTDMGNAARLAARHGKDLLYCWTWGRWLTWNGRCWAPDESGAVYRLAKDTARSIFVEAAEAKGDEAEELGKWALRSQSEARLKAMVSLAQSEPGIPITPAELDRFASRPRARPGWRLGRKRGKKPPK